MAANDVTGTTETAWVYGNLGAAKYTQDQASIKETEGTGQRLTGSGTAPAISAGPGNFNPPPVPSTPFDTEGVGGAGRAYRAPMSETDPTLMMSGTLDTTQAGPPVAAMTISPAYRVSSVGVPATNVDTSWTDRPISDGSNRPDYLQTMTGTMDTVNQVVTLKTTSKNAPTVAPAALTVAVTAPLTVTVTVPQVTDPVNAKITGYRVECARVLTGRTPSTTGGNVSVPTGITEAVAVGTDFAPRAAGATTSVVFGTLTPSEVYVFRAAAVNDNGVSPYSPWSAEAVPKPYDTVNDRYELNGTHVTRVASSTPVDDGDPTYKPDGTIVEPGQVATLAAAATATAGQVKVDWTAPTTGAAVTGYKVTLSNGATATPGLVLTNTFTGQPSGKAVTATVVPLSARGAGLPKTSGSATPV